jgi:MoxR-like ATPase
MTSQAAQVQARAAAQATRGVDPRAAMQKIAAIRTELNDAFVEKQQVIDALLIALLSGQNIVLLGSPGEAKSSLLEALTARITGANLYKNQLWKSTLPDELFGPLNVMGMKQGVYERVVGGYMPDQRFPGTVIYLDETFKGSSAILNTLLRIINEHEFKNGTQQLDIPLLLFAGASNEYPTTEELQALWDRMTIRVWVNPLTDAGHRQFMATERARRKVRASARRAGRKPAGIGQEGTTIAVEEVLALQTEVLDVDIPDAMLETWYQMRELLSVKHGTPSTRRSGWLEGLLCANAVLNGRTVATEDDLVPLQYALWNTREEIRDVAMAVMGVAAPVIKAATEAYDAMLSEIDACLVLASKPESSEQQKATQLLKARAAAKTTAGKLTGYYHQLKGAGRDTAAVEQMMRDTQAKYDKALQRTTDAMNPDLFGVS